MADLAIDRAQLEIIIKNDESRKRLRELEEGTSKLAKELRTLEKQGKKDTEAYREKEAAIRRNRAEMDRLINTIGLTGLTMKELKKRQSELNLIMAQMDPRTPEYKKLEAQLAQVSGRIRELRGGANEAGVSLKGMADGFNRYFGMVTTFLASITGLVLGFRSLAEKVAHMDDVYSDVMKTTKKTRDEVVELNEEFKQWDTRTAREQLNLLARDAGKLGRESRKDILDFVEAGNQINVALGEDLGDDAIKNIGKMVGVYQDATQQLQNIGLKEQMLAVGSAINELGSSSTASEPYLVSFAGRLGGISKQAKISIADILGYASALDQDMQAVEMSATAFQNFIMKLTADPAKFARIAGLEVKSFSNLLKTDANAAIKQVLTSMNERGGFQELIPIFEEMGLEGARAVGVLSAMAGSIEKIDEAQKISNQAMVDGTSITAEYNIKNNNLQAGLEKARKAFLEKALVLGEKLTPALTRSTNGFAYIIKILTELPRFIRENQIPLILLAGAFLALQAAKIKVIAASALEHIMLQKGIGLKIKDAIVLKALLVQEQYRLAMVGKTTIAQKAAAIATATWRSALLALGGPLGLAVMGVTGLIAAIKLYDQRNSESLRLEAVKQQRLNSINEINKQLNITYNATSNIIRDINSLNFEQIQNLSDLTAATIKQAEADLLAAKIKQQITQEENTRVGIWDRIKNQFLSFNNTWAATIRNNETAKERGKEAAAQFNDEISALEQNISDLKTQHQEMTNILTAEAKADKIAATTISQFEEKARLLSIALRSVNKDSEDYNRINAKLTEVNKELNKANTKILDDNAKLITAYQELSNLAGQYKDHLTDLVMQGDLTEAMKVGQLLSSLQAAQKFIDDIVAAGGNLDVVIDKVKTGIIDKGQEQSIFSFDGKGNKILSDDWVNQLFDEYEATVDQLVNPENASDMQKVQLPMFDKEFFLNQTEVLSNAAFNIWKNKQDQQYEYELNRLNRAREAELANKNLTEAQKDAINDKYRKREAKLKAEAFRKQKAADILQAIINGALAITKTFAAYGFTPAGWAAAIGQGIATGAQVATIASTKVPQYSKGKYQVTGADDNRTYHASFIGTPKTGIIARPSLIAENGGELIIDAPTTSKMMANAPGLVRAIYRMAGKVPQRADGSYPADMYPDGSNQGGMIMIPREYLSVFSNLENTLRKGVNAKLSLFDLKEFEGNESDIENASGF
jgi:TP901 family phage tail tape measure protein